MAFQHSGRNKTRQRENGGRLDSSIMLVCRDSDDGWPAADSRAPSETDAAGKKRNIGSKMLSKLNFKQKAPEIRS